MALDAETRDFLDLTEAEIGSWAAARAAASDLPLPPTVQPGVIENLTLLRNQAALFVEALGEAAGQAAEVFQP